MAAEIPPNPPLQKGGEGGICRTLEVYRTRWFGKA